MQWIKASERLPKLYQRVCCRTNYKRLVIAELETPKRWDKYPLTYDDEKIIEWLDESEGQQQGEGVSDAMMLKGGNTHQEKFEWLMNKCSKLQSQLTVKEKELKHWQELYKDSEKLLLSYDVLPVINFLEKIDSSSMSDKTWLAEQKNLRKEGKELRERLTGKEIEEVVVKLKK